MRSGPDRTFRSIEAANHTIAEMRADFAREVSTRLQLGMFDAALTLIADRRGRELERSDAPETDEEVLFLQDLEKSVLDLKQKHSAL
jgi:hypothetical protein